MFCEACGRNLLAVERLPTRAEREREQRAGAAGMRPLAERCADATAAFLAAARGRQPGCRPHAHVEAVAVSAGRLGARVGAAAGRPRGLRGAASLRAGAGVDGGGPLSPPPQRAPGLGPARLPYSHHTVEPDAIDMPLAERLSRAIERAFYVATRSRRCHAACSNEPKPSSELVAVREREQTVVLQPTDDDCRGDAQPLREGGDFAKRQLA
jgi:hypothetical protein